MNTKKKGNLRFFAYFDEKSKKYVLTCVDLCIVKEGKNMASLKSEMDEAVRGYLKLVISKKMPDYLLNKSEELPNEIKEKFLSLQENILSARDTFSSDFSFAQSLSFNVATQRFRYPSLA